MTATNETRVPLNETVVFTPAARNVLELLRGRLANEAVLVATAEKAKQDDLNRSPTTGRPVTGVGAKRPIGINNRNQHRNSYSPAN